MNKTHAADLVKAIGVLVIAAVGEVRYLFARTTAKRLQVASQTERLINRLK